MKAILKKAIVSFLYIYWNIFLREKVGWKVAKALKRMDDGISHAAIDMLCALMEPMHQVVY